MPMPAIAASMPASAVVTVSRARTGPTAWAAVAGHSRALS
jgi:hypothetical protein